MTTAHRDVLAYLRRNGECTALQVSQALGMRIESVYLQLVRAESAGRARISISRDGSARVWDVLGDEE